jgi:hypothetical protein
MEVVAAVMSQTSVESLPRFSWIRWIEGFLIGSPERQLTTFLFAIGTALTLPLLAEQLVGGFTIKTAKVVSGAKVEVACMVWSPWSTAMTFARVSGGCACTSATIEPMTIKPWSRFVVRIVYDSSGKPLGRQSIVVRAVDDGGIAHELPVRFDIEVEASKR